ncbi:hypothetical protein V6N13_050146 [Hibiscus sabdariffa]
MKFCKISHSVMLWLLASVEGSFDSLVEVYEMRSIEQLVSSWNFVSRLIPIAVRVFTELGIPWMPEKGGLCLCVIFREVRSQPEMIQIIGGLHFTDFLAKELEDPSTSF